MEMPAGGWRDEDDVSFLTVSVNSQCHSDLDLYCNSLLSLPGFLIDMDTFIVKPYMFMVVTQKQNLYLLKLLFKFFFSKPQSEQCL